MVSAVFNISIFSVYFLYMLLHILYFIMVCDRARWSAGALGDRARYKARDTSRQISDVTVSIDYRV